MYFSKAKLGEEGLDGEGGMRGLDPGCCFPADCSHTSTSQAASYRASTSTLFSLNPCRRRGLLSILILTFGRGPPALQIATYWPLPQSSFEPLPELVFSEKVRKWQCDSVSYTFSSCSTDTPLVLHTCVCFHQEKHIFKPFRNFWRSVKAVSADTSTCHFWQCTHLLVTVWSLRSATWDERTRGESLRASKDR